MSEPFTSRHIGPGADDVRAMLDVLGLSSLDELIERAVPPTIRTGPSAHPLDLPAAMTEPEVMAALEALAARNERAVSLIGMGYHGTHTPAVITRNVLESPAWYTAYTPYQPEISQGRLEALLNFQTMVCELTGMDLANASLLDEATAAAEAMALAHRVASRAGDTFVVDPDCHPQTLAVLRTRAEPVGITVVVADPWSPLPAGAFGILVQYPGSSGSLRDPRPAIEGAHAAGALAVVAADPLACVAATPPGEMGADVVVGSAQRFGVPMFAGGPHAAFMATRDAHKRQLPGRLVGVSVDGAGRPAFRLALQTREQHIRREKATSNICTAQVLLAVVAGLYACWHGPDGLRRIAADVHERTRRLAGALRAVGATIAHEAFFDTLTVAVPGRADAVVRTLYAQGIDVRFAGADRFGVAVDETTTDAVVDAVVAAVAAATGTALTAGAGPWGGIPEGLARTTAPLRHEVFARHHSETEMLRYLRRLADRDLALDRTMIPLGSCTMKLNATTEMATVTWPAFAAVHPFAPPSRRAGTRAVIDDLEAALAEVTGYDAVSLQPNAGSQGEYAGLLAIRAWHASRGEGHRDVCLIPSSAHGTNPASAQMAGMRIVVVACDPAGNVDVDDLAAKLAEHGPAVAALMVTYPSTHGVFEERITEVCDLVHAAGAQVYLDGANLNALVGVARPGRFGADVSHVNLHKTFCIPHGGGGPGVGPIGVKAHLAPFLPGHPVVDNGSDGPAVAAAPWGSAGILQIPWAYLRLMGPDGLRRATEVAILSANYVAARLEAHFPVLYRGHGGFVAHECILDLRDLTKRTGVTAEDVAKRLADYGFHAPTLAFPVAGTLMVEPTESEGLGELDRFCDAMVAIRAEIDRVGTGEWPADDNPLHNAPHTAEDVTADDWRHPYSRQEAAYPLAPLRRAKYWPPVGRIDGAHGDRNVVCTCPPLEAYA